MNCIVVLLFLLLPQDNKIVLLLYQSLKDTLFLGFSNKSYFPCASWCNHLRVSCFCFSQQAHALLLHCCFLSYLKVGDSTLFIRQTTHAFSCCGKTAMVIAFAKALLLLALMVLLLGHVDCSRCCFHHHCYFYYAF